MRVAFFEADTLESGEIDIGGIDTTFFAVIADGNDSVFYDPGTTDSVYTLPLDPANELTAFEFYMIDSVITDTISHDPLEIEISYIPNPEPYILNVSYRSFTRVITEDCGVEIGYGGLSVDETTFPSYEIDSDRLSRFNEPNKRVNIEIFF